MYVWYRVIFLLFPWMMITMHATSPHRCAFKRQTSFQQCGSRKAEVQRYNDRDINRYKPWIVTNDIVCNHTAVCQRLFRYVLCFMDCPILICFYFNCLDRTNHFLTKPGNIQFLRYLGYSKNYKAVWGSKKQCFQ